MKKTESSFDFEKILYEYEKKIFNYLRRLTGRREDAEDLTQDTFLKLYRWRKKINPQKNLKSFLFQIATHAAIDWLRKQKARREIFAIDDPKTRFETMEPGSSYYKERLEGATDIEKALGEIKPIYRTVLLLFYKEGFRYEEMAELLELPINTVKTRLRRAKQALKETYEKES